MPALLLDASVESEPPRCRVLIDACELLDFFCLDIGSVICCVDFLAFDEWQVGRVGEVEVGFGGCRKHLLFQLFNRADETVPEVDLEVVDHTIEWLIGELLCSHSDAGVVNKCVVQDIPEFNPGNGIIEVAEDHESDCSRRVLFGVRVVDEVPSAFELILVVHILNDVHLVGFLIVGREVVISFADPNSQCPIAIIGHVVELALVRESDECVPWLLDEDT